MPTWHNRRGSTTRREPPRSLHRSNKLRSRTILAIVLGVGWGLASPQRVVAAGSLTIRAADESTGAAVATRLELYRGSAGGKPMPLRRTIPAGFGVVLDRRVEVSLAAGPYAFRMIRGPEYRVLSGSFTMEQTSLDESTFKLPRMVDMQAIGWTSGDCLVPATSADLPLRMASEDLHVAAVLGHADALPVPANRADEPLVFEPVWTTVRVTCDDGLAIYRTGAVKPDDEAGAGQLEAQRGSQLAAERLVNLDDGEHAAIENPFAWPVPVWLASGKIDGFFVLGDWLRLDRSTTKINDGRQPPGLASGEGRALGRAAERIYWKLLDAGFKIPPLAGSGDGGAGNPVGYNRLYVAEPISEYEVISPKAPTDFPVEAVPVDSELGWWSAAWAGRSIATNGPLLRPKLAGELPGHTFTAKRGEVLELAVELTLSVRDPVDYLEVVRNGEVHYSARLDEFALAGGKIPSLTIDESSWVVVRVVTLFEDHFRAAMSAPWYIEFDGRPRITRDAVEYFQAWQNDYEHRLKQQPPAVIKRHVPGVQAARQFWTARFEAAQGAEIQ